MREMRGAPVAKWQRHWAQLARPRGVRTGKGLLRPLNFAVTMTEHERRKAELNQALLNILDEAMSVDEAACGKIRVYNPQAGTLEIRVQRGLSEEFLESFGAVREDEPSPCARAFRLRHRVTVPDVMLDPHAQSYRDAARAEGFKAMQVTPLIGAQGRVVGTLSTHFPRVHHPSKAATVVLDHWAKKAATMIERLEPPDVGVP